jgi:glycosyltransferase involved in cell wall biosynthesis
MREEKVVVCLCMLRTRRMPRSPTLPAQPVTSVLYLFRDSPQRRAALALEPGSPARYALYGMDELVERGWSVRHNLEAASPGRLARVAGTATKRGVEAAGGYGGDFATVVASLREAERADVVLSTVDTVGIPLMLLARARVVRTPFVYVAIGLPERLARLRSRRVETVYAKALARASSVVAYSEHEAESLETWLRDRGQNARVEFVPFGVDVGAFRPVDVAPDLDVVSVGADPHRDFELLLAVARSLPDARFLDVASADHARSLGECPPHVSVEADLPFDEMRDRLERARVVALPVRDNSYSGATTVLLQAMALAKPVVVTRTVAIASGYGLVDGENVRLVEPSDISAFGHAVADLLGDDGRALSLGGSARRTVESQLGWTRYVDALEGAVKEAASVR